MSQASDSPSDTSVAPSGEAPIHPRSDLLDGLGWIVLGIAILIGSVNMDRLEQQHINPYTVPGLLPGLLGIMMILLGGILALRSWRRGALRAPIPAATADDREQRRRIWIVIVLCMGYAVVLVGHGIPFWLASAIYVTGSILILQRLSRDEDERRYTVRGFIKAVVIGLGSGVITSVVFQELFLVRMP
ncbi:MAG TPA: tripartite tricarboxylate transporter TctB family protein [Ramlibacter sp.]|nr:tripartite tricarboxylate transporter TctB family protein [Ramlibacter sp.]